MQQELAAVKRYTETGLVSLEQAVSLWGVGILLRGVCVCVCVALFV